MMAREVRVIPASVHKFTTIPFGSTVKKKVAGYARVSTDLEEQLTSYEAQVDYYTKYIQNNPDWEFVEVYTDEGISATSTKRRDGFNRMIQDALDGKIDLIITKSVSRFARNVLDSLNYIFMLRKLDPPVGVYFETEKLKRTRKTVTIHWFSASWQTEEEREFIRQEKERLRYERNSIHLCSS